MMRTRKRVPLLILIILSATALMSGCALFGKKEQARLIATLESVEDDYHRAELETEVAEEALNELVVTDVPDLEQAFQAFSESVERIQETGNRLVTHADEMLFNGPSYLVESGMSPTRCIYPRQRVPEDKVAAELGDYFFAIADEGWHVKRAWRAYQFDISQIRNYLSANLTPNGVEAMTVMIRKAQVDGENLKESLDQALTAIEEAKAAKGSAGDIRSPVFTTPLGDDG